MKSIVPSIILLLFCFTVYAKPKKAKEKQKKEEVVEVVVDSTLTDSIAGPSQEPVFALDIESYHFGVIDTLRQDLEYDFNFCNEGLDTLKIHRIITAPGVTVLERELINQYGFDEGGTIRFVIDPKEIKGKFKKSIFIYSNTPTKRLTLSGTVLRPRY
jgi:hypothetical protein